MKTPLIIPKYTHNVSNTINMLIFGSSYMYCNKYRYDEYYVYKSGNFLGEFYENPKEAYSELINHELANGLSMIKIPVIKKYK